MRRKSDFVRFRDMQPGQRFYHEVAPAIYDEYEIVEVDPAGNTMYRNNSRGCESLLYCAHDAAIREKRFLSRKPPRQLVLFRASLTIQTSLI